jgi:hypothetical protein
MARLSRARRTICALQLKTGRFGDRCRLPRQSVDQLRSITIIRRISCIYSDSSGSPPVHPARDRGALLVELLECFSRRLPDWGPNPPYITQSARSFRLAWRRHQAARVVGKGDREPLAISGACFVGERQAAERLGQRLCLGALGRAVRALNQIVRAGFSGPQLQFNRLGESPPGKNCAL